MKTNLLRVAGLASALLVTTLPQLTQACTDFKLKANDGTYLITRTMEFAVDLNSNMRTSPTGRLFQPMTPNNKPGLEWKSKHGYVYLDGFNIDFVVDGLNDAGLSFEYLYLPGETNYQNIPEGKDSQTVPYGMFGDWVLGNFKTVDEVKEALNNIYVSNQFFPELGKAILPAHATIHDQSGKGIVVEFYNDKINVFDSMGVMTNSPKYDWQVTNLRNYINLSALNPRPVIREGMVYSGTGQGAGAYGLPGDASPPSRFVKTSFMVSNVFPAANAEEVLNLGQHIINNVDLPAGYLRSDENGKVETDITQWVVFKDITNKIFYYRTYNDMTLRAIDMSKLDLSEQGPRLKMTLVSKPTIVQQTDTFKAAKGN